MPTQISTGKGTLVLCVVALLAAAALLFPRFTHDPYSEQQTRNLVIADRYVRTMSPILLQDSRFLGVRVSTFTGADGSVVIDGRVASDADFSDLKRVIEQSQPRITALFQVQVG